LISRRHVTSERQAYLYPPYRTSRILSLGFRCFCGTERINWTVKDMNTSSIPSGYCSNLTRHPGLIAGRLQRHGLMLFLSSSHGKSFRHGKCPEFNYWFSWNRPRRGGGFSPPPSGLFVSLSTKRSRRQPCAIFVAPTIAAILSVE
jgi:hypothetical protein